MGGWGVKKEGVRCEEVGTGLSAQSTGEEGS